MACQSAIRGMFKNIPWLKMRLPGLLPKVVCTLERMACIAVESASTINSLAAPTVLGGFTCNNVRSMLPTVWCILSQIAFACRFLLVVDTSFMCIFLTAVERHIQRTLFNYHGYIARAMDIWLANFVQIYAQHVLRFYFPFVLFLHALLLCLWTSVH